MKLDREIVKHFVLIFPINVILNSVFVFFYPITFVFKIKMLSVFLNIVPGYKRNLNLSTSDSPRGVIY